MLNPVTFIRHDVPLRGVRQDVDMGQAGGHHRLSSWCSSCTLLVTPTAIIYRRTHEEVADVL